MRKEVLFMAFVAFSLQLCAQQKCSIQGTVKGLTNGEVVELCRIHGNTMETFTSDTVYGGKFAFEVEVVTPPVEHILLLSRSDGFPNTFLDLYIAPGQKVNITGENKLVKTWQVQSSIEEQAIQNRFVEAARTYMDQRQILQVVTTSMWKKISETKSSDEQKQLRDSIRQVYYPQIDSLEYLVMKKEIELMREMPVNPIWMYKLESLSSNVAKREDFPYTEEARALFQDLTTEQRGTELGLKIAAQLFPPQILQVGDRQMDGDLYDLQGNIHHLADYQGKYILLDFWSVACVPCLMAMDETGEVSEEWKNKLTIVSISTDEKAVWEKVCQVKKLSWVNLNDLKGSRGICAYYDLKSIPYYVILSPEGKIVHTWSGYQKGIIRKKIGEWVK